MKRMFSASGLNCRRKKTPPKASAAELAGSLGLVERAPSFVGMGFGLG